MAATVLVNAGWGNGLLPDGTKPLPQPLLTHYQGGPLVFIHSKVIITGTLSKPNSKVVFECYIFETIAKCSRGQLIKLPSEMLLTLCSRLVRGKLNSKYREISWDPIGHFELRHLKGGSTGIVITKFRSRDIYRIDGCGVNQYIIVRIYNKILIAYFTDK